MRVNHNRITALTVANFRTFSRQQNISIKPITLIYGQNSSGKSSILKALKWIKDLAHSSGLNEFHSHLYQHDLKREMTIGYELDVCPYPFEDHHEGQAGFQTQLSAHVRTVKMNLVIATVGKWLAAIADHRPDLSHFKSYAEQNHPRIASTGIDVNGEHFVTIEMVRCVGTHSAVGDGFMDWKLVNLNAGHPLVRHILSRARDEIQEDIDTLFPKDYPLNASNNSEGLDPFQAVAIYRDIIRKFNLSEFTDEELIKAATKLSFLPNAFPPQAIPRTDHLATVYRDGTSEINGLPPSLINRDFGDFEAIGSSILERFRHLLGVIVSLISCPTEMNLGANPIDDCIHVPPIRSIPTRPFFIDERKHPSVGAMDWPMAKEETFLLVNHWFKSLGRHDTNYELVYSKVKTSEENPWAATSDERLKFSGIRDLGRGVTLQLPELGVGISQIIPVLLAAFQEEEAHILIEQPELHLHPALQAEIADVFIDSSVGRADGRATEGAYPNQFIIETHSEHILLRILRRIRETSEGRNEGRPAITPNDVSVIYVENNGDHSVIHEMPINEKGELIRDWPGGFFEEGIREVLM